MFIHIIHFDGSSFSYFEIYESVAFHHGQMELILMISNHYLTRYVFMIFNVGDAPEIESLRIFASLSMSFVSVIHTIRGCSRSLFIS